MKKILLTFFVFFLFLIGGCTSIEIEYKDNDDQHQVEPKPEEHECKEFTEKILVDVETLECGVQYEIYNECNECGKLYLLRKETKEHNLITERVEATCVENGYESCHCTNCDYIEYYGINDDNESVVQRLEAIDKINILSNEGSEYIPEYINIRYRKVNGEYRPDIDITFL